MAINKNIIIFASGNGSNAEAIIKAINEKLIECNVALILSNNSDSGVLNIARKYGIPGIHLSEKVFTGESYLQSLLNLLEIYNPALIILAGFMRKIPLEITNKYQNRILNIHPALLPKYGGKGMYGINVHRVVFENKEQYSGITIHLVNENYDEGKILFQERIFIGDCSSPEEISEKVLELEHKYYPLVINNYISHLENKYV